MDVLHIAKLHGRYRQADEMNLDIGREVFVTITLRRLRYVEEFDDSRR
jgi:hypothetical protein